MQPRRYGSWSCRHQAAENGPRVSTTACCAQVHGPSSSQRVCCWPKVTPLTPLSRCGVRTPMNGHCVVASGQLRQRSSMERRPRAAPRTGCPVVFRAPPQPGMGHEWSYSAAPSKPSPARKTLSTAGDVPDFPLARLLLGARVGQADRASRGSVAARHSQGTVGQRHRRRGGSRHGAGNPSRGHRQGDRHFRQWPGHLGRDDLRHLGFLGPHLIAGGLLLADPRGAGQCLEDGCRHAFRAGRHGGRDVDREPGHGAPHQLQGRPGSAGAEDHAYPRRFHCKERHPDHGALAPLCLLKARSGEGAFFTNGGGLRLAQSASLALGQLEG